ncbi:hypothetical protein GGI07_000394 [Coemansia sp. Benny D115]|nr:hypothetical protein GGI07_000394 [Coemansia sp. Benny D115]
MPEFIDIRSLMDAVALGAEKHQVMNSNRQMEIDVDQQQQQQQAEPAPAPAPRPTAHIEDVGNAIVQAKKKPAGGSSQQPGQLAQPAADGTKAGVAVPGNRKQPQSPVEANSGLAKPTASGSQGKITVPSKNMGGKPAAKAVGANVEDDDGLKEADENQATSDLPVVAVEPKHKTRTVVAHKAITTTIADAENADADSESKDKVVPTHVKKGDKDHTRSKSNSSQMDRYVESESSGFSIRIQNQSPGAYCVTALAAFFAVAAYM